MATFRYRRGNGNEEVKPHWYRRIFDAVMPSMWSDRRKFLTGVACAGLAWIFHRFAGPHVLCVPTNTVLSPLTGELVAVGEVALVRISTGDTISVRL